MSDVGFIIGMASIGVILATLHSQARDWMRARQERKINNQKAKKYADHFVERRKLAESESSGGVVWYDHKTDLFVEFRGDRDRPATHSRPE